MSGGDWLAWIGGAIWIVFLVVICLTIFGTFDEDDNADS